MDWSLFSLGAAGWGDELLHGLGITLALAVLSFLIGTIAGTLFGLVELHAPRPVAALFAGYALVLRSVPELLVIFLTYYAAGFVAERLLELVGISTRVSVSAFAAGVMALAMVQAAYTSEVIKGAVRAVPGGLHEAARALGMRPVIAFWKVTLPLALRYAFPGLANLWMVVIKNTPFVSAIGVTDFIGQAGTAGQNTKHYFAFFLTVLLVYLVISGLSMIGQLVMERRLFRHVPAAGS